jgi:hypothetical protein
VRIQLRKVSDQRHELAIVRPDGRRESVACETRSVLLHDFIHYAVEAEAKVETGFWGRLARGRTLAEMNDRARPPSGDGAAKMATEMATIERFVGALHGAAKGQAAADVVAGIERYAAGLNEPMPAWLTETFVVAVQERLRRLVGAWNATPYGETLELDW